MKLREKIVHSILANLPKDIEPAEIEVCKLVLNEAIKDITILSVKFESEYKTVLTPKLLSILEEKISS